MKPLVNPIMTCMNPTGCSVTPKRWNHRCRRTSFGRTRLDLWTTATAIAGVLTLSATGFAAELSRDSFGVGTNDFSIDFVTVSHLGNPDDTAGYPYEMGGVSYRYRMGKHEVSEEVIAKANAAGDLKITTTSLGPKKPAGDLSFYEAARFVNWLNTSSGHHPAYNLNAKGEWLVWPAGEAWELDGQNLYRHKDAFYFVPSADEWYKAAYYNGTNYFRYATGSNSTPIPVASGVEPRTTVYAQPEETGPADVDNAGGLSPYGTMAQGGNVPEWIETAHDGSNDTTDELLQIRGGRWTSAVSGIRAFGSNSGRPWHAASLRVAALPRRVPMAPELTLRPDPNGGGLELSWLSQSGVDYDVERAASPTGDFLTLETLSGTGGVLRYVFRPMQEGAAFYQVVAIGVGL